MYWDILFQLSNFLTAPFWLIMILLPKRDWTQKIINSLWIVAPIALLYLSLLITQLNGFDLDLSSGPQLAGIAAGLSTSAGATIAWAHFLAFDLFVGRWIYLDSRKRARNPIWMGVILLFTYMLGPFGLLLYLVDKSLVKE